MCNGYHCPCVISLSHHYSRHMKTFHNKMLAKYSLQTKYLFNFSNLQDINDIIIFSGTFKCIKKINQTSHNFCIFLRCTSELHLTSWVKQAINTDFFFFFELLKKKREGIAARAHNHETDSNLYLISCSLRWLTVMHVMIIITLVITCVNLFNISSVNTSHVLLCDAHRRYQPPVKTSNAVVSLFSLETVQDSLGVTLNVALIRPTGAWEFCHRRDHCLISKCEEGNFKTTSDPSLVKCVVIIKVECDCWNCAAFQPVTVSASAVPGSGFTKWWTSEKHRGTETGTERWKAHTHTERDAFWGILVFQALKFSQNQTKAYQNMCF